MLKFPNIVKGQAAKKLHFHGEVLQKHKMAIVRRRKTGYKQILNPAKTGKNQIKEDGNMDAEPDIRSPFGSLQS